MRYYRPRKLPRQPLVSLVVAAYERPRPLQCLLTSLLAQTYENIEIVVVHDGPPSPKWLDRYRAVANKCCRLEHLESRQQKFGYPARRRGLELARGEFVGFANDDCYYVPVYLYELLLTGADFAYCDMIHSHRGWQPIAARPQRKFIDIGNWLARTELVRSVPWKSDEFAADAALVAGIVARTAKVAHVKRYLYVHN